MSHVWTWIKTERKIYQMNNGLIILSDVMYRFLHMRVNTASSHTCELIALYFECLNRLKNTPNRLLHLLWVVKTKSVSGITDALWVNGSLPVHLLDNHVFTPLFHKSTDCVAGAAPLITVPLHGEPAPHVHSGSFYVSGSGSDPSMTSWPRGFDLLAVVKWEHRHCTSVLIIRGLLCCCEYCVGNSHPNYIRGSLRWMILLLTQLFHVRSFPLWWAESS